MVYFENKLQDEAAGELRNKAATLQKSATPPEIFAKHEKQAETISPIDRNTTNAAPSQSKAPPATTPPMQPLFEKELPLGGRTISTFGNTKVLDRNGKSVVQFYPNEKVAAAAASSTQEPKRPEITLDYTMELNRIRTLDPISKEDGAMKLYLHLGSAIASAKSRISHAASVQSGLIDADKTMQINLALEAEAIQSGKIPRGAPTVQVSTAREQLEAATKLKRQIEQNMLTSDQELAQLLAHQNLVVRELNKTTQ